MTGLEEQLAQVTVDACLRALSWLDDHGWMSVPKAVRHQVSLLTQDMTAAARDGDRVRVVTACTDMLGLLEPYRDAAA